ncbi:hypothetical protein [Azospirillum halopraeferens]|uniref:hypothetical protein n=1 Tax=Azospirillum halopraeferens TaxID=34010 RepID=UPI000415D34B|nr:hypothetical protein [Azospirillum halopraeferens]
MLSFSKLLLLILVFVLVFFGWRWLKRIEAAGRDRLRERGDRPAPHRPAGPAGPAARSGSARADAAEDLEKCPECGAYVAPRSAVACGRPGCPYGG